MGLRFRRSVRLMPGVRLNFSGSGVSLSAGVRGASMTFGPRGTYANAGIPGTGLYTRGHSGDRARTRLGPLGLWQYADHFLKAARTLPEPEAPFEPVRYYLTCHSLELALKAYLGIRGATMLDLSDTAYGHSLDRILDAADKKGLDSLVHLSTSQREEICNASTYYQGKVFEYPAYGEAFRAYPKLPQLSVLIEAATILVEALHEPCLKATDEQPGRATITTS